MLKNKIGRVVFVRSAVTILVVLLFSFAVIIISIRHGESVWNITDPTRGLTSRFTGWADVDLTNMGIQQAAAAGRCLQLFNILPNAVFTSLLRRSRNTFEEMSKYLPPEIQKVPVINSWRLNERHYGALVGLSKDQAGELLGEDELLEWRRSWDKAPPPMSHRDLAKWNNAAWAKPMTIIREGGKMNYVTMEKNYSVPKTESLEDCANRSLPLWLNGIAPRLARGETILVVAHANSIRAMIKHIDFDTVTKESVRDLKIPSATPLIYEFEIVTIERTGEKVIRPIGKPTSLGMRGRYICTKELMELSVKPSKAVVPSDPSDKTDSRSYHYRHTSSLSDPHEIVRNESLPLNGADTQSNNDFYNVMHKSFEETIEYAKTDGKDEALIITDGEGVILYSNPAWTDLCGFELDEIQGRTNKFLQGPLTDLKKKKELDERLQSGLPTKARLINYRKSGAAFVNELTIVPIYDWHNGTNTQRCKYDYGPTHFVARLDITPDRHDLTPLTEEEILMRDGLQKNSV